MLRGLAVLGLLLFRGAGAIPATTPARTGSPFETCKDSYNSICSLGDSFMNKMPIPDERYQKVAQEIVAYRKGPVTKDAQDLAKKVFSKLLAERKGIFKDMKEEEFKKWENYLKLLVDLSVKTHSHNIGKGTCGEATKASIANSLLRQLETHTRETVQLVDIGGETVIISDSATVTNPNHIFAVYNSKTIVSHDLQSNFHLNNLMKNLNPENPNNPVVTCDSWLNYHANPGGWFDHLQAGKDHFYGKVNWTKIKTTDYSIPSLRANGMTPAQRKFLTELMRDDILRPGIKRFELEERDKERQERAHTQSKKNKFRRK